jgi:hypothetical protein
MGHKPVSRAITRNEAEARAIGQDIARLYDEMTAGAPAIHNADTSRQVPEYTVIRACVTGLWGYSAGLLTAAVAIATPLIIFGVEGRQSGLWMVIAVMAALPLILWTQAALAGMRGINFVRNGVLSWAVVVDVRADTGPDFGEDPGATGRLLVTIVYKTGDDLRYAECRVMSTGKIRDNQVQQILYDPRHPATTCFVNLLPSGLWIDADGKVRPSLTAVKVGLLPVWLALVGIIAGAALWFHLAGQS